MALIVEDGTGKSNAESYISVADFKVYADARGLDYAGKSDTQIEQAARKSTEFITACFRYRWKGVRTIRTQRLDWPRYDVFIEDAYTYLPINYLPPEVAEACAELIVRALVEDLLPDAERLESRVKIGPLEIEFEPNSSAQVQYTIAYTRLAALLNGQTGSGVARVIRT